MRPEEDDPAIELLLGAVPELLPFYRDLAADYEEDLGPNAFFRELAELVSSLLADDEDHEDRLERIFAGIEEVARVPGPDRVEAVAYSFLLSLPDDVLERVSAYLGPASEELLARLSAGDPALDDELGGGAGDDAGR